MSSVKSDLEYEQDRLDARDDLKEDGYIIQLEKQVESGDSYNPLITKESTDHWCIPINLNKSDIWGNVQADDRFYVIDAINTIENDYKIIDNGNEYQIVRIEEIN